MQRFTLHSNHLNKDPALTLWENQLIISTNSEVSTTEALVLFTCYDDVGCGVIKMLCMIRLVRKSDKQAVLRILHECTDTASTASPGHRVAAHWGQADTFLFGEKIPSFWSPFTGTWQHLEQHFSVSMTSFSGNSWAQALLYFCCLRQQTASCLLLLTIWINCIIQKVKWE